MDTIFWQSQNGILITENNHDLTYDDRDLANGISPWKVEDLGVCACLLDYCLANESDVWKIKNTRCFFFSVINIDLNFILFPNIPITFVIPIMVVMTRPYVYIRPIGI